MGLAIFLIKVTRYGLGSFMLYMELMVGLEELGMSDIRRFGAILLKKWIG